ncbi:MAG: hypothetical protein LBK55_01970 [Azoarcus sp.]|jgi:hypothetical protein|nr:hypothetical protein [Azoarcus sp.]
MANILARRLAPTLVAASALFLSACGTFFYSKVSIGLDKSRYLRGEEIVVTIDGITARMANDKAILATYAAGAGHGSRLDYVYLHAGDGPPSGADAAVHRAGKVTLPTPSRIGAYELRFYSKTPPGDDTLVARLPFTVDGNVDVSLILDKAAYARGEEIIATLDGVTPRMHEDGAFLAIYPAGGIHESGYFYPSRAVAGDNRVEFSTPPETGAYELRFYRKAAANEDNLAASVPFPVDGDVRVTMKLDKKVYAQDEKIAVKLTGITDRMSKDGAFLIIYEEKGGHSDNFAPVFRPAAGDGTAELRAPDESGNYEVRLYRKSSPRNGSTLAATLPFTVKRTAQRR